MVTRITVCQLGREQSCALIGFGIVLCGFCGHVVADPRPGWRCSCGATVIAVERVSGNNLEGTYDGSNLSKSWHERKKTAA